VSFDNGHSINVPDFSVKKGEKIMFFGESGIGKSTIFNVIMGLYPDYQGDVIINGVNLRDIDLASLRDVFGITFQAINVLTLTLKENILLGADGNVDELIKLAGLQNQSDIKTDEILNDKVLSGGEKSRLGLAQTLVRNPDIILIDETFSNVDEAMEAQIISALFEKYPEKTVVCISHRSASQNYFDKVINFL